MTKSLIDLDDEALAGAAALYGTTNKNDTVNTALREAAKRQQRIEAMNDLAERAQAGQFDELMDKRSSPRPIEALSRLESTEFSRGY